VKRGDNVVSFRFLMVGIIMSCSMLFMGSLLNSVNAEPMQGGSVFIHNAVLPAAPNSDSPSLLAPGDPVANYDEQLGLTFTENFSSLTYNVTTLALTDDNGVGPAYLLNGLTATGYWYQIGVSYNWPYSSGGHINGFYLSYNVFNSAGNVVLPSNGAGGILPFSGSVYSGDLILLSLNFSSGNVVMYAKDWNTNASASISYSARSSTSFIGVPNSPSSSNGFFSGLMTEWYHVLPYYGDMTAVTYTNHAFNLSSAWMWMDEWNPSNRTWSGSWSDHVLAQYSSNPSQLQQFSSHGATVFSNASTFITGSIGTLGTETTTITLLPAGQSTPLSSTNQFAITYNLNNAVLTAYAQNASLTLTSDANTHVIVSGTSTGSSAQEKWVLNANGNTVSADSGANLTLYYYDLLSQSASYTIIGGGNPLNPTLTYTTAPSTASEQASSRAVSLLLSQSAQTIWSLRGSVVSVTNPILGSSSEQWATPTAAWNITAPNQLPSQIAYTHQFMLTVTGAQVSPQWYNSGATAQILVAGVSGRASGLGQRVTSYSVDGGASTTVQPTTGTVAISVLMNAAHQLQVSSVKQYQVTLDSSAAKMLASITSPAVSGDNYWYDEAVSVKLVLNGVGSRSAGTGDRLASYSVNDEVTQVSTANQVTALNIGTLLSPQTVSAVTATQFQLSTPSGLIESITAPPIAGDAEWYDAGTLVTVKYYYSWNSASDQSRANAVSYAISQGATTALNRSGNGTFSVQVAMTKPESILVSFVTQFHLSLSGGYSVVLSQTSPTGDSYFDSGSTLTATTPYVWGLTDGNTRQSLFAYTLDGATFNVTRAETGNFTTPTLTFNKAHELIFNSAEQYLVSFQFKDNSGMETIAPVIFQIESNSAMIDVPQFSIWLDKGTVFQARSIIWENAEVKPSQFTSYVVNQPLNEDLSCRVFNAKLSVVDYLGIPISGAQVAVTLANQTTIQVVSASDGIAILPLIPLGTFNAEISYLGTTTTVAGDASTQTVIAARVLASVPTFGLIAGVATAIAVTAILLVRKRNNPLPNILKKPNSESIDAA
jgi:hypothetical protein